MVRQPPHARGVQVGEVAARQDHAVQQDRQLVVALLLDGGHLTVVTVTGRLPDQERAQGARVALAQDVAKLLRVVAVARGHRWPLELIVVPPGIAAPPVTC